MSAALCKQAELLASQGDFQGATEAQLNFDVLTHLAAWQDVREQGQPLIVGFDHGRTTTSNEARIFMTALSQPDASGAVAA